MGEENSPVLSGLSAYERSESLFTSGLYSDLTVLITDSETDVVTKFRGHKCILATISPVWEAAIKYNRDDVINLKHHPKKIVERLLAFAYLDKVEFEDIDMCMDVIKAADFYNIQKLEIRCTEYMESIFYGTTLSISEFVKIFNKASLHKWQSLITKCFGYIQDNGDTFFGSDGFLNLNIDALLEIAISNEHLCAEYILIRSVLKWAMRRLINKSLKTFLEESKLLPLLRFRSLFPIDMVSIIDDYPDLFTGEEKYMMLKSFIVNAPISLDFISSYNLPRGFGNHETLLQISVSSPPFTVVEEFLYDGDPTSLSFYSFAMQPRLNSFFPDSNMIYEEHIGINFNGIKYDFHGLADRESGSLITLSSPVTIMLEKMTTFTVEITLKKSGVYKKYLNSTFCRGFSRVKGGLIKSINDEEKSSSDEERN